MKCKDIFSVSDRKVGSATQKLEEIQFHSSLILHTNILHTPPRSTSDFHLIMTEYC